MAQTYHRVIDVRIYLVSEKYNGVRATWDGSPFHTRTGREIAAPTWFTNTLHKTPLDCELWLDHGKFDALSGAVRKDGLVDEEWRGNNNLVFEPSNATGTLSERATRITEFVKTVNIPRLKAVKQC